MPEIQILDNDIWAERIPHLEFTELRAHAPVAWFDEPNGNSGFWAVTRLDDLVEVHRNHRIFSSQVGGTELEELERDPEAREARRTMLETDPPEHTRIRKLVSRSFTRRAIEKWESTARALIAQNVDKALSGGPVDFVETVARRFPIQMISKLLGVPDRDAEQLFHWADAVVYHADPDFSELLYDKDDTDLYRLLPFRSPSSLKVFEYAQRLAEEKKKQPEADVVSILADATDLSSREFETFFLLLVIAGNETTRHSLSHGALALAEFPDQLERLREEPTLIDTATEEILRWASPQIHFRRTAVCDTQLAGVKISAGDKVVTWYISANYDERTFVDPFTLDLGRSPNPHVTFGGGGPHICLGAWMARLEVRVFLEELVGRVRSIRLEAQPERIRSNFINGLKHLPLVLEKL
ncbi:MAG: cytochrome P450 [Acidimicrobiales bacterium]|nr:cytochrome P450 [Acidimicrobiales bacterium]